MTTYSAHTVPAADIADRRDVAGSPIDSPATELLRAVADLARERGSSVVGFTGSSAIAAGVTPPETRWRPQRSFAVALPRTTNDGRMVPLRALAELVLVTVHRFGGVTLREAGGLCLDHNRLEADWLLDLEIWTDDESGVVAFAREVAVALDQRAVGVRVVVQHTRFVGQEAPASRGRSLIRALAAFAASSFSA
jgi:hypothetical protein